MLQDRTRLDNYLTLHTRPYNKIGINSLFLLSSGMGSFDDYNNGTGQSRIHLVFKWNETGKESTPLRFRHIFLIQCYARLEMKFEIPRGHVGGKSDVVAWAK